jgi:protein-L-isoaspartate(D-aspartate) O-methyltransferase
VRLSRGIAGKGADQGYRLDGDRSCRRRPHRPEQAWFKAISLDAPRYKIALSWRLTGTAPKPGTDSMKPMTDKHLAILRRHMVDVIGIHADLLEEELGKAAFDEPILTAMSRIPRHMFVPEPLAHLAYEDRPLPIGFEKTISQPFICALMTDLLALEPQDIVLEVGTGLGYQTSILAELVSHVWSVEIVEEFADGAQLRLEHLGYKNVDIRVGDGSRGWPDHAPYDKAIVTAAAETVPPALLEQLKPRGRLVMPLGATDAQQLTLLEKDADGSVRSLAVIPVRFTQLETVV